MIEIDIETLSRFQENQDGLIDMYRQGYRLQDNTRIHILQATNLLINPGFESGDTGWFKWQSGTGATFSSSEVGRTGNAASIEYVTLESKKIAQWMQDVLVTPGKTYKISGWIKTSSIVTSGTGGVYIDVNWKDTNHKYLDSTSVMDPVIGTTNWTYYEKDVIAPLNAVYGSPTLQIYDSSGKAWFDDISFIGDTTSIPPGGGGGCTNPKYKCVNGVCISDNCDGTGTYTTSNCNNACAAPPPGGGAPPPGGGGGGFGVCSPACTAEQYCIAGTCVEKKYITYGAIGVGALLLLSILK